MNSQDILFYSLSFGFLVLVGFLSYTLYYLSKSSKALTLVLRNAKDITDDVKGVESVLSSLLSVFFKKGVRKNGKQ